MTTLSVRPAPDEDDVHGFFSLSPDLLCVVGIDGSFERLNPAWSTHLGWALDELKARPFFDWLHPDDRAVTQARLGALLDGTAVIHLENRCRCRDGSYRWLQWTARAAPDGHQICVFGRDLTRRRWLEQRLLEAGDREQARLGRDLHDGLCQTLAGIAALSATLSKRLQAAAAADAAAAAAEITLLLHDTIKQARDLGHGLDPVGLRVAGIDEVLRNLASDTEHRFQVPCAFACDRPAPGLRQDVKMHLFRIAQEAVRNAVSHARASRIDISLRSMDGTGVLCIQDDGPGLGDEPHTNDGFGLYTMTCRARLLGGALEVAQAEPRGTAVACTFPLHETPDDPRYLDDAHGDA